MKKRIIAAILAALSAVTLTACKPSGMSQSTYDLGLKALKIEKQYLDMDISEKEATNQIGRIFDRLADIGESMDYDEAKINAGIKIDVLTFKFAIGLDDFESMREGYQTLKKDLGE